MFSYSRLGGCALFLLFAILSGCSKKKTGSHDKNPAEDRLLRLGKAYIQASFRLERAPKDFAEIKQDIQGDVPDDFLRSPGDGEEFVIMWGVAFHTMAPTSGDLLTVGGYEKRGAGGSRYVLRFPLKVSKMTDAELKLANFPPGFGPPQ